MFVNDHGETVLRLRGGGCFSWFAEIRGKNHDEDTIGHTPILYRNTHEPSSETANQKERPKFNKNKTKIKGGNSPRIKAKDQTKSQNTVTPVRRSRFNFDQEIKSNNDDITTNTVPFTTTTLNSTGGSGPGSALGLGLGKSVDANTDGYGDTTHDSSDGRRGEEKVVVGFTV